MSAKGDAIGHAPKQRVRTLVQLPQATERLITHERDLRRVEPRTQQTIGEDIPH